MVMNQKNQKFYFLYNIDNELIFRLNRQSIKSIQKISLNQQNYSIKLTFLKLYQVIIKARIIELIKSIQTKIISNKITNQVELKIIQKLKNQQKKTSNTQQTNSQNTFGQTSNFYQTYINLFVNFFNKNFDSVNLNSIKSIIRPNNRFVLIDLLKALLQFARNDIKILLKSTTFYQKSHQNLNKIKLFRANTQTDSIGNQLKQQSDKQHQLYQQQERRRIHTQPQISSPKNEIRQAKIQIQKISPSKQFRTKNTISTSQFTKLHSTQMNRFKSDQAQELNNRYLHANFIQFNIKQSMYQKNIQFVNQLNLQKLENKVNNIYIELNRLNCGNAQIISKFYEDTFGKKNKFNYDSRGLYSQCQIQQKKYQLIQQIEQFQRKLKPNLLFNSVQLVQYSQSYTKCKNKQEQLQDLIKQRSYISSRSTWIPLNIQFTTSIIQPLKIQIEQTNLITGELFSYHWKKYKKQYSICDYFKQRLKNQHQKLQSKHTKVYKNNQRQSFKKQKFRKSNFLDNRKKVNQFLLSNNIITTKKQSIFPVLKGIQQNFIKNNNTNNIGNLNNPYTLDNNFAKYKIDPDQRLKSNVSTSKTSFQIPDSSQKQKRFDSIKKTLDVRQKLERKQSESQKFLQKYTDNKQKTELLSKLSVKYDLPQRVNNRKVGQKYQKKSLISISRVMDIRGQINLKQSPKNMKMRQNLVSGSTKHLSVLNLI